ncbi:major royal jelly protein 5-like [Cloeon dipterum]|uniref:major royal jelly protein 5-like n=1 Tax=Cloeon dipterum TaxID=197152 RepID=UPI0032201FD2
MSALFAAIFLVGLCLANAVNFTTVYEWDTFDFVWPSGAETDTSIEQIKQIFNPKYVDLRFMAVFGERLFLSIAMHPRIPATLVWLPTSSTSTAPPKLAPFPSWNLHKNGNCETIQAAKGMETDPEGRLWVLDDGSTNCASKLWIFDLLNSDTTERVHQFPDTVVTHSYYKRWLLDIVLDKTPDDYVAYIADSESEHIVVYNRKMDKSWSVITPERRWFSLALSPNQGQLYLGRDNSKELYSMPVSELKNGAVGSATVKLISEWNEEPYRMLFDSANVLYAAFHYANYTSNWNISEPFREQRFHEVGKLRAYQPFSFALDTNGSLWMMERNETKDENKYKLLQAEVGAKSYQYSTSTAASTTPQVNVNEETSKDVKSTKTPTIGGHAGLVGNHRNSQSSNTIPILLLVCCFVILWLTLRMRRMQTSFRQIQMENNGEMFVFPERN